MKTFPTVEDYLEVLAGKRDLVTGLMKPTTWLGYEFKPIVSLARYDTNFLDSVTDATLGGQSLTDRQAELAIKLINKYQRQLANKSVDTSAINPPRYRNTVRVLDRSRKCWLEDHAIYLRFPYNEQMIQQMRELSKTRQGRILFDKEAKVWKSDLGEYNLNFLVSWAKSNDFEIDTQLTTMLDEVIQEEARDFKIRLTLDGENLVIENAATSLLEYIGDQGLKMNLDDLLKIADLSSVLGFEIDPDLKAAIDALVGGPLSVFVFNRQYELAGDASQLKRIIDYATAVDRLPVVVFDPSPTSSIAMYNSLLPESEIQVIKNNREIDPNAKLVFTHRALHDMKRIPLLISHVGLLVGAEKHIMVQNSEKIIYFDHKLG